MHLDPAGSGRLAYNPGATLETCDVLEVAIMWEWHEGKVMV